MTQASDEAQTVVENLLSIFSDCENINIRDLYEVVVPGLLIVTSAVINELNTSSFMNAEPSLTLALANVRIALNTIGNRDSQ